MGSHVGDIERGEGLSSRFRIVVGRPADKREAREGEQRVDLYATVLDEEFIDRRASVETGREGGNHAQSALLERSDDAVIVAVIAGQQVGAQQQDSYCRTFIAGSKFCVTLAEAVR